MIPSPDNVDRPVAYVALTQHDFDPLSWGFVGLSLETGHVEGKTVVEAAMRSGALAVFGFCRDDVTGWTMWGGTIRPAYVGSVVGSGGEILSDPRLQAAIREACRVGSAVGSLQKGRAFRDN